MRIIYEELLSIFFCVCFLKSWWHLTFACVVIQEREAMCAASLFFDTVGGARELGVRTCLISSFVFRMIGQLYTCIVRPFFCLLSSTHLSLTLCMYVCMCVRAQWCIQTVHMLSEVILPPHLPLASLKTHALCGHLFRLFFALAYVGHCASISLSFACWPQGCRKTFSIGGSGEASD